MSLLIFFEGQSVRPDDIQYAEYVYFDVELNKTVSLDMKLSITMALDVELNKTVTMQVYQELESTT